MLRWKKYRKTIPSFGRAKEIVPESKFEFFVILQKQLKLPKLIRLGKWMSKAEVKTEEISSFQKLTGDLIFPYVLNPLDVMFNY